MIENRISIQIPPADIQKVRDAFATIQEVMGPLYAKITKAQKTHLSKMSDGSLPFVQKALEFAETTPQFNPPFMDVGELRKDLVAYEQLKPFFVSATSLTDDFKSTYMLAGAEAYQMARLYYASVQLAARMGVPGAQAIYDELKKRYEAPGRKDDLID